MSNKPKYYYSTKTKTITESFPIYNYENYTSSCEMVQNIITKTIPINDYNKNNYLIPKTQENRLKLNILYYDELLLKNMMLNCYCAYIQMNISGTFYGCHKMELFNLICEKLKNGDRQFILITSGSGAEKIFNKISNIYNIREYYILCSNNEKKNNYIYLMKRYSKLKEIFEDEYELDKRLSSITPTKINESIKSSNLIYFDEYLKIYVKLHFEIIRKYGLYKILKQANFNEEKFLSKVKSSYPKLINIANQLFPNKNELIDFFTKKVDESPKIINDMLNVSDTVENYINNYTIESFYYRNLNLFLRTGDFDAFRTLSSHLSKFVYYLYEYREKNPRNYNLYLYRKMTISEIEFKNYQKSVNRIICYPSFTSTSSDRYAFVSDYNVLLVINSNNSKSVISIEELSNYKNEKEYLFLPFSFFRITNVIIKSGTSSDPHIIFLTAMDSDKPIEEMFYYFFKNYTDSLDPEGLDILKIQGNKIVFNNQYY